MITLWMSLFFFHFHQQKGEKYVILLYHKNDHIYFLISSLFRCDVIMSGASQTKLAVLLEQASHISEELAVNLRSAQGSSQIKAVSQKLLENHILMLTHIVKQLSQHMTVCIHGGKLLFFLFLARLMLITVLFSGGCDFPA